METSWNEKAPTHSGGDEALRLLGRCERREIGVIAECARNPRSRGRGLGSATLTRGDAKLGIELRSGLPALPRGVQPGWPLASYRVTSESKQPKAATAELEIDVGWMQFGAGGETRLLSWNGKQYRDVTGACDEKRGLLRGRVRIDELLIVVRTPLCYSRFVPINP